MNLIVIPTEAERGELTIIVIPTEAERSERSGGTFCFARRNPSCPRR